MAQKEEQTGCDKTSHCAMSDCASLNRFYNKMRQYCQLINDGQNKANNIFDVDNNNLVLTLNDFLHLLQNHNYTDEQYESVIAKLKFFVS